MLFVHLLREGQVQLPTETLSLLLQAVWSGEQALTAIEQTTAEGQQERIAEGVERSQTVTAHVGQTPVSWQQRLLIVRAILADMLQWLH